MKHYPKSHTTFYHLDVLKRRSRCFSIFYKTSDTFNIDIIAIFFLLEALKNKKKNALLLYDCMHIADKLATFHMLIFFYPSKFAYFTLVTSIYDVLEILCKVIRIYCLYTCLKKLAPSF